MATLDVVPRDLRNLRACLVCSIIKTFDQFEMDGCDNCDEFLRMRNNRENVYACTSSNFDGMIAVMSNQDSWVCKWQRISNFVKGIYAISVSGKLPPGIVREMKSRGIRYRSRDVSRT